MEQLSQTVGSTYEKLSQREHILKRPDSYCGSTEPQRTTEWVLERLDPDGLPHLQERIITKVPALYTIFDEIIVNAADHAKVCPRTTTIKIDWSVEEGWISVWNNGDGIPGILHPKHDLPVPELIFGHLLTSSNYDDSKKRVTGGRNGYGAKITNVFSKKFVVETQDTESNTSFKGTWTDNMTRVDSKVKAARKGQADFTKITFWPDWERLNCNWTTEEDHRALLGRRCVDVAGTTDGKVRVFLHGQRIHLSSFKQYCMLFMVGGDETFVHESIADHEWQVAVALSPETEFRHVSFVNDVYTKKGGPHVEAVAQQICKRVIELLAGKRGSKGPKITPSMIRQRLLVFVKSRIVNPTYSGQTKEELQTRISAANQPKLSDRFIQAIVKSKIIQSALEFASFSEGKTLHRTDGKKVTRITGIEKLDDANKAGGRESSKCTLILTEGDSAKALAVSGINVIGRDYYGVFPLKGKSLNVRGANPTQVSNNEEINNLKKIIGLKHGEVYTDISKLRYGRVMIMCDADTDGSHIKGLILNLFQVTWPSLLAIPGFLCEFVTPVVRATRKSPPAAPIDFFTQRAYADWFRGVTDRSRWHIQYYKGLGTSTSADSKKYFSNLARHVVTFKYDGDVCDRALALAFEHKQSDARKEWIMKADPGDVFEPDTDTLSISDFVHRELVHFSIASNLRAIPSVLDGLKPGQRKILWTMLDRKITSEMKVAAIGGKVMDMAAYHHGEASLNKTIIAMAQDYLGSNNWALLEPAGQFGTRASGGEDAASARYISTYLKPSTIHLFPSSDAPVLKYQEDDGKQVEPTCMAPILPMVLVNGADGIGTGFSTNIPPFNLAAIVENLRRILCDPSGPLVPLLPWYRHFRGKITPQSKHKFIVSGAWERTSEGIRITELPTGKWTKDYKAFLEKLVVSGDISGYQEYHTDYEVDFQLQLDDRQFVALEGKGVEKTLGLQSYLHISNMVLFDPRGVLRRYECAEDILRDYVGFRLEIYRERKRYLMRIYEEDLEYLVERVRFIVGVLSGQWVIQGRSKAAILDQLSAASFKQKDGSYDYLLGLPLWSLTSERVEADQKMLAQKRRELEELVHTTVESMWLSELDKLLEVKQKEDSVWMEDRVQESLMGARHKSGPKKRRKASSSAEASGKRIKKEQ